ncbi:MAG: HlyD family secretion protein [Lacunisphaera sp.]
MNPATESSSRTAPHLAPSTHHRAPKSDQRKRGIVKPLLIGAVVIAGIAWGVHFGIHAYHYVETDNAYITGHLHQVSAQIDGQIKDVRVDDNQDVKAGDVLVRLDPLEFQIAVQKADASVEQARAQENQTVAGAAQADAQLAEAKARVTQAEAQIIQARAQLDLARLTAGRNDQLLQNGGATTKADVDSSHTALAAAEAAVDAATANHTAAQAAVGSAQAAQKSAISQGTAAAANVAAAQAAAHDAQRQLAYTTIVAPSAGRVGNKMAESGNRVLAGQALLAITEPNPWIVANFKETQLPLMKAGQPVEITIDALPDQILHGQVDSFSPASGAEFALLPPDNATGNFNKVVQRIPVKIVLDADSLAKIGNRLRFGYSAIVNVRVR